jgi:hypothetical protein
MEETANYKDSIRRTGRGKINRKGKAIEEQLRNSVIRTAMERHNEKDSK